MDLALAGLIKHWALSNENNYGVARGSKRSLGERSSCAAEGLALRGVPAVTRAVDQESC